MSFLLVFLYGYFFLALLLTYFIYRDQKRPKLFFNRHKFLAWFSITALWAGILLGLFVRFIFPYLLVVNRQPVPISSIREPINIALVTDIQVGNHKKAAWAEKITEKIISTNPDLVLLGGDLIDNEGTFEDETEYLEPLKKLAGKFPVYYVLGNHEYGIGNVNQSHHEFGTGDRSADVIKRMKELQIPELSSQLTCPQIKKQTICIFGMDDIWNVAPNYKDLQKLKDYPSDTPLILLTHNPDGILFWPETQRKPDLVLAGHSHGGQIWLPFVGPVAKAGILLGDNYYKGLNYWHDIPIFTSVGTGESAVPLRFIVTPEIALINLNPPN